MSLTDVLKFITNHPLNRGNKLRSILRFAKWQVESRLAPDGVVYDWVGGSKFRVRRGETGLTGNVYTGLHEFPDMGFVLHVLREEDLFVDVGANVGSYTVLACAAAGARGYAFEPVPGAYRRLVENVRLNQLGSRVRCLQKGVGARQGSLEFTSDSDTTNHALAAGETSESSISVEVTSLDAALKGESPALAKIDVEGYEARVLAGASETLRKQALHSVILELNEHSRRYGVDESKILELMFDHGFRTYSYNPFDRSLVSLEGKNPDSDNTLFVRDKPLVEERLRSSPKFSVHGSLF